MGQFAKIIFSLMLLLTLFTATAIAQTATATIKGVVADGNNNVAAGAVVTLTQTSTGLKRTFTTSESGQYTFTFIEPGQYTLDNMPRTLPNVRGPGHFSTNISLQRDFKITETIRFQFRAESYNVFNRANFTTPSAVLGANNFGRIIATEDPRQFQFGAKLYF